MSMKLGNIQINRDQNRVAKSAMCGLANGKGDFINVTLHLEAHHNLEQMTFSQFEQLAIEAAKKLHP
jgi:hypothetical protein